MTYLTMGLYWILIYLIISFWLILVHVMISFWFYLRDGLAREVGKGDGAAESGHLTVHEGERDERGQHVHVTQLLTALGVRREGRDDRAARLPRVHVAVQRARHHVRDRALRADNISDVLGVEVRGCMLEVPANTDAWLRWVGECGLAAHEGRMGL